jgi:hypothetical protein
VVTTDTGTPTPTPTSASATPTTTVAEPGVGPTATPTTTLAEPGVGPTETSLAEPGSGPTGVPAGGGSTAADIRGWSVALMIAGVIGILAGGFREIQVRAPGRRS